CYFFQAEDGIRDATVTGVQTCALPIFEAIRKSFMMMTESMAVMRNAVLTNDNIGVLSSRRVVAEDAARVVFLLNRRYVTTTSWFWKILFDLSEKPKDFNALIKKICGFVPTTVEEV